MYIFFFAIEYFYQSKLEFFHLNIVWAHLPIVSQMRSYGNIVIDIFLHVTSWNIIKHLKKAQKLTFFQQQQKLLFDSMHSFDQTDQLIRKINGGFSCIIMTILFDKIFLYFYIYSLEFFVKRTKTSLLSFYFKTYNSITIFFINLIIIILFKFRLCYDLFEI